MQIECSLIASLEKYLISHYLTLTVRVCLSVWIVKFKERKYGLANYISDIVGVS